MRRAADLSSIPVLALLALSLLGAGPALANVPEAPTIYQLQAVEKGRVLDGEAIAGLDTRKPPWPADGAFAIGDIPTRKGAGAILRFSAVHWGSVTHAPEPVRIHELLLVEVGEDGVIVAAAHYTLEWQDVPSAALYKATKVGGKLTDGLDIASLALTTGAGATFAGKGVLDLVLGPRRVTP